MSWIIVFLVALILELLTTALVSIWFSIGAVFAFVTLKIGMPLSVQVGVFVVVSFATLFLTKPFVNKKLLRKVEKTNVDALVGSRAIVTCPISNLEGTGEVKVDGKVWTARSVDDGEIPQGSTVVVQRIEGVKVIVSKE